MAPKQSARTFGLEHRVEPLIKKPVYLKDQFLENIVGIAGSGFVQSEIFCLLLLRPYLS